MAPSSWRKDICDEWDGYWKDWVHQRDTGCSITGYDTRMIVRTTSSKSEWTLKKG
jgi:hypothetical protein